MVSIVNVCEVKCSADFGFGVNGLDRLCYPSRHMEVALPVFVCLRGNMLDPEPLKDIFVLKTELPGGFGPTGGHCRFET